MAIGDLFPGQAVRYSPKVMAALNPQATAAPAAAPTMASIPGLGNIDLSGIDLSGIGYQSMGLSPDYTPAPNYLVKPAKGLTAADVALQELAGVPGLQFVTNKGNPAGVKDKETKEKGASGESNISGFVPVVEGATYRIRNEKGKDEVLYTGTGAEGLKNVYAIAQDLSAKKGKKANWGVEMQLPGEEGWRRVADDDPAKGFLNEALDVLGDAALGFLVAGPVGAVVGAGLSAAGVNVTDIAVPMLLAATPLGPIAGAGIGSFGASVAQGRSFEDSLIRGLTAAATAGVVEGVPGVKDALGSATRSLGIDKALSSGVLPDISRATSGIFNPSQVVGDQIIVPGVKDAAAKTAAAGIGNLIGGSARNLINQPIPGSSGATPPPADTAPPVSEQAGLGDITVTAAGNQAIKDAAAAALAGAGGSLVDQVAGIGGGNLDVPPSQTTTDQQTGDLESQFDQALGGEQAGIGDLTVTAAAQRAARIDAAVAALLGGNSISDPRLKDLTADEFAEAQEQYRQERQNQINVEAANQQAGIGGAAVGAGAGDLIVTGGGTTADTSAGVGGATSTIGGGGNTSPTTEGDEIKVTAKKEEITIPGTGGGGTSGETGTGDTKTPDQTKEEVAEDKDKGLSTKDYIRLALAAPSLFKGIGDLLGGGDNTKLTLERSPLTYTPLNRQQTAPGGAGIAPAFDVFTYGQNVPGAQKGEFTFFKPYDIKAAPQTYAATTASDIYTQADVDAANATKMADYNAKQADFNTYQNTLAAQVAAGTMTPAQAQAAAQQFASGLGYTASAPAMAEGGEVNDDMVKHLIAYSEGGGHKGPGKVSGIGSGQEDLIPAWLSDGEYVWSAQDVSDLGDGSTEEGVRRLDRMRQMVRKNAGRKDVKNIAKPQPKLDKMLKAVGGPV